MKPVLRHPNAPTSRSGFAVAVEVSRLDVGDPREACQLEHAVAAVLHPPEPRDAAVLVVAWQERPEVGDQQVVASVLVQVEQGRVRRVRDVGDDVQQPGLRVRRPSDHHVAVAHLGGDDLELAVAVDVGETHVGHRRRLRRPLGREGPSHENDLRRGVDGGPRFRRGKRFRRVCGVEAQHALHVRRQHDHAAQRARRALAGRGCPGGRASSWRSPRAIPTVGGCRAGDSGGTRCRTARARRLRSPACRRASRRSAFERRR